MNIANYLVNTAIDTITYTSLLFPPTQEDYLKELYSNNALNENLERQMQKDVVRAQSPR